MEQAIIYDGPGAEHHPRETGRFEVHYGKETRTFDRLVVAFFFYFELNRSASLWNTTEGKTLIERKLYLPADAVDKITREAEASMNRIAEKRC